jgi:excinuclease ABC subunit A
MTTRELDHILIQGAREHNLKSVTVRIPKKRLVVFTGVSGSGKSSLAFDTLYAEGQRRYVESLSAYARQFLGQMEKPKYDAIRGLTPTISIEQKTTGQNPRSTVGTITEIADYLRVLYARVGRQHCHECQRPVEGQTAERIVLGLLAEPRGTRALLLTPLLVNRKGEHRDVLARARESGIVRLRVDGKVVRSELVEALDKRKKHDVEAVVDRIVIDEAERARLTDSVEQALRLGGGTVIVAIEGRADRILSDERACTHCGISFPELTPQAFSFNSPQGMCHTCNGLGTHVAIDPARVVPNPSLSLDGGAIAPWGPDVTKKTGWAHGFRGQIVRALGIDAKVPWRKLPSKLQRELLHGAPGRKFRVRWKTKSGKGDLEVEWEGVLPRLMRRFSQTGSERAKRWYQQFMGDALCESCGGGRMRAESAAVRVGEASLVDLSRRTVEEVRAFFEGLELEGADQHIAEEVLKEVRSRLMFLESVGLGYLSLDRSGPTLSGGEAQRIRLASQVGSELSGVTYVLDEPSIGLHQRDNARLVETLCKMRDLGNTVVVVEHDEDTIRAADHVVDFGLGAGVQGGHVVFAGSPQALEKHRASLTGAYLSGRRRIPTPKERRAPTGRLLVRGARANNLKGFDVFLPLGVLTVVTGVSGAGKSTLVSDVLAPALSAALGGGEGPAAGLEALEGTENLDRVVIVDQKAIGRTPRSNPSTYVKVFDEIRGFFAKLPDARARGYGPGRFSFNVKGGRCESCEGDGVRRIEMHFLPDVFVACEACRGRRFNEATLGVTYRGRSIADVLELTVAEALELFAVHPKIAGPLALLAEVGLDYLHLGQPSPTLSGGEAQRIKLARELAKRSTGRTLYVLDEPTTGLHFHDVEKLLAVLARLVEAGNTVVVIEHELDVIRAADWVIDLGPDGGAAGGHVVAEGIPEVIARTKGSHTGRYLRQALARHDVDEGSRRGPRKKAHSSRKVLSIRD